MFCSKCGNKSPVGARFCHKCGTKIINETLGSGFDSQTQQVPLQHNEVQYANNQSHVSHVEQARLDVNHPGIAQHPVQPGIQGYQYIVPQENQGMYQESNMSHQENFTNDNYPSQNPQNIITEESSPGFSESMEYSFFPSVASGVTENTNKTNSTDNTNFIDYPMEPIKPTPPKKETIVDDLSYYTSMPNVVPYEAKPNIVQGQQVATNAVYPKYVQPVPQSMPTSPVLSDATKAPIGVQTTPRVLHNTHMVNPVMAPLYKEPQSHVSPIEATVFPVVGASQTTPISNQMPNYEESISTIQSPDYAKPHTLIQTPNYVEPPLPINQTPNYPEPHTPIQVPDYAEPPLPINQTPNYPEPHTPIQAPNYAEPLLSINQTPDYPESRMPIQVPDYAEPPLPINQTPNYPEPLPSIQTPDPVRASSAYTQELKPINMPNAGSTAKMDESTFDNMSIPSFPPVLPTSHKEPIPELSPAPVSTKEPQVSVPPIPLAPPITTKPLEDIWLSDAPNINIPPSPSPLPRQIDTDFLFADDNQDLYTQHQNKSSNSEPELLFMDSTESAPFSSKHYQPINQTARQVDYTDYKAVEVPDYGGFARNPDYDPDMITHMPHKKSKFALKAVIAGVVVALIAVAVFMFVLSGRVGDEDMVGTWTQPGPLMGSVVTRMQFNIDGTGRQYRFNEHHRTVESETQFVWWIEGRNRLYTSLWENEGAIVQLSTRTGRPTLRYRRDSHEYWYSYVQVPTE